VGELGGKGMLASRKFVSQGTGGRKGVAKGEGEGGKWKQQLEQGRRTLAMLIQAGNKSLGSSDPPER
jgi:hypothetical protein